MIRPPPAVPAPAAPAARRAPCRAAAVALTALLLAVGCGDEAPAVADGARATPPDPAAALRADDWWQRAEDALARIDDPAARAWTHAYFALCLERLGRPDEAEAHFARVDDPALALFALERLAALAWRDGAHERFARRVDGVAALIPGLESEIDRAHHHELLFVLQTARGERAAAADAWRAAHGDPEPTPSVRDARLVDRLAVLAALGRTDDWHATWDERHEPPPSLAQQGPLLRALLLRGETERVEQALLEAPAVPGPDGLTPAQALLARWAREGLADAALPLFERVSAAQPWPPSPAPPAELGLALARAGRTDDALAFAERLPADEAARVHAAVAVAYERAGAGSAADALLARRDVPLVPALQLRRMVARAAAEATPEAREAAVALFLARDGEVPPGERDVLDELVRVLHEQGDQERLRSVAGRVVPRLREAQALPLLAALTAGVGLDDLLFRQLGDAFDDAPQGSALLFALAALVARDGPNTSMPPMDLGLRREQLLAALAPAPASEHAAPR